MENSSERMQIHHWNSNSTRIQSYWLVRLEMYLICCHACYGFWVHWQILCLLCRFCTILSARLYKNETAIGNVLHHLIDSKKVKRKDLFITSKLWVCQVYNLHLKTFKFFVVFFFFLNTIFVICILIVNRTVSMIQNKSKMHWNKHWNDCKLIIWIYTWFIHPLHILAVLLIKKHNFLSCFLQYQIMSTARIKTWEKAPMDYFMP